MPTLHVYEKVVTKEDQDGELKFDLEDGTWFMLPRLASTDGKKIEVGDRVLIDLVDWRTARKLAMIQVFRDNGTYVERVTEFHIGHNCLLKSPLFDKK